MDDRLMGDPGPSGRSASSAAASFPSRWCRRAPSWRRPSATAWADPAFRAELDGLLGSFGGRPTPVTECRRLSAALGVRILLKREDLAHTGSHKINNVVGQALLARRMGKRRLIAETGAGQHGVATATAAALFGLDCVVYMGEVDTDRQELNVFRMELLGAEVRPVSQREPHPQGRRQRGPCGTGWPPSDDTHYCVGSVMGPHPFPWMVREFQRVVGDEARRQCRAAARRRRPRRGGGLRRRRFQRRRHLRRVRRRHGRAWWRWRRPAGRR